MHVRTSTLALALAVLAACGPDDPGGSGACVETFLPGDLVITEIFPDADAPDGASGADEGREWFEIYNASGRAVDLAGLAVTLARPDGSRAKTHTLRSQMLAPGAYLVLGNVVPELAPAYVGYGYAADLGDMFNTEGGKLTLGCGTAVIDEAEYAEVVVGASTQFDGGGAPDYTANDNLDNWCPATPSGSVEFAEANFGTPGDANEDCEVVVAGQCSDGGTLRATVPPNVGDLVITEIMPSPDGTVEDDAGEWVEVLVTADVDLNGVSIDRAGDSSPADVIDAEACLRFAPGTHVVLARSDVAAQNGGIEGVIGTFDFTMVAGSMASPGDVQLLLGTQLLDAFAWTGGVSNGKSLQLDPGFSTPDANDMERYWCEGTTEYTTGNLGTPGAANAECAILPAEGMCVGDGGVERAIVAPMAGELVITEFMASPDAPQDKKEWIEVMNVGAAAFDLNGLSVFRTDPVNDSGNVIASADCLSVAPGGFGLFARSSDETLNGMLPPVDATFSFSLVNGSAATPCAIEVRAGANVLDAVAWIGAPTQKSRQLDPDSLTTAANDLDDRPGAITSFCDGVGTYGPTTNTGTPKVANVACP